MTALPSSSRTRQPNAEPLPKSGVLVIGTPRSAGVLRDQLASLDAPPALAGCVLVDEHHAERQAGVFRIDMPPLGGPDDLETLHARGAFKGAVISLPASMNETITDLDDRLDRLGVPRWLVPTIDDLLRDSGPATTAGPPTPSDDAPPASATQSPPRAVREIVASVRPLSISSARVAPASPIDLAALVGRAPHALDNARIARVLGGKRVLITGAGGSIGSELARVAGSFNPASIILVERAENALFEIDRQIARRFAGVSRRAILHDVVDAEATRRIVEDERPDVIFHAAAHKHVPLMEDHPAQAVNNNFFGTRSIADASDAAGIERFVMISTDKAVNPTSVMGATKRLAELYVQSLASRRADRESSAEGAARTRWSIVRFGNVLGSACSVLTIWSAQLAEGGPITVTDPRMTRYFMTIPEAAALVAQAAALDQEPDAAAVYVLDMGEPVRILDLARRFLSANGRRSAIDATTLPEDVDGTGLPDAADEDAVDARPPIPLVFSGARPGEKIHEELAYPIERLRQTEHPAIRAWGAGRDHATSGISAPPTQAMIESTVRNLSAVRFGADRGLVIETLARHLHAYRHCVDERASDEALAATPSEQEPNGD